MISLRKSDGDNQKRMDQPRQQQIDSLNLLKGSCTCIALSTRHGVRKIFLLLFSFEISMLELLSSNYSVVVVLMLPYINTITY